MSEPIWTVSGEKLYANLGGVARAGDVNGDGFEDVIVGASQWTAIHGNTCCQ